MRTGDDQRGHHFTDALCRLHAGIHRRFHRADIPLHHDGDQAGADVFIADQLHVGGFAHGIRGFNAGHQTFGFDKPQCITHGDLLRTDCVVWLRNSVRVTALSHGCGVQSPL
ncbi:hypothetical protein AT59_01765 [Aeromonas hydrophila AD9]|nr:hypothetical protein AT59_01765 [Aeromonas hydrophila AD9]